ncbi:MAG: regulatory protein RecX [Candidatus Saccharimonadales bacterium]
MRISDIKLQVHDSNRVSVYVDGKYSFSLTVEQINHLKIKVNNTYENSEIEAFKKESKMGKVYLNAILYCMSRPRSQKEIKEYLFKKTIPKITKSGKKESAIDQSEVNIIFDKLVTKNYVNDRKFAEYWVENRFFKKGISRKRLTIELKLKGIDQSTINEVISNNIRNDKQEIQKIIARKAKNYTSEKLFSYLIRQGFSYEDVKSELNVD